MVKRTLLRILFAIALTAIGVACVVETDHHGRRKSPPWTVNNPHPEGGVGTILVEVDTDKKMTALPGDGVGIFVEYQKGGLWHLWWTCDTNKTAQICDFNVRIATQDGPIQNANTEVPGGPYVVHASGDPVLSAATVTGSEVHGVRFETRPGAVITLDASVGILHDGSFIFFVQDEKVNGDFSGKLSNPIQFVGKSP